MPKLKKQTVRVVLEYKVTGSPDDETRSTTVKDEREVAREMVEVVNARGGFDVVVKLKSVEVLD